MSTTNLQSAPVFSKICFRQLVEYSFAKNFEDKLALIDNEELNICNNIEVDFIALLFCTHGNIELDINNEHYFMGTNDMFYSSHHAYKSPIPIVTGKMLFYFLLYFVLGIYMFTFVTRSFSLPQLGDYGTFLAFLVPFLLACIFLAIVLSTLVYRREDCIMIFVFLSVPLLFLSGISWPEVSFPVFWKYVSWLFPSTFGLNGYVRIQGMGASLHDVAFEYCGLWIQAGVYFLLACLLYRRQIIHLTINKSSK